MKLTKIAQELKDLGGNEEYEELTQEQEELSTCMGSEGFSYALFEGGYLKPEQWVEGEDLTKLLEAIKVVEKFKNIVEEIHQEF